PNPTPARTESSGARDRRFGSRPCAQKSSEELIASVERAETGGLTPLAPDAKDLSTGTVQCEGIPPSPPGEGEAGEPRKRLAVQSLLPKRELRVPSPGGEGQGEGDPIRHCKNTAQL